VKDYFQDKEPRELKERVFIITWAALFFFFILVARLWYLQVIKASHFKQLSRNNSFRLLKEQAPRGIISDRNGLTLVENRPGFDLSITPEDIPDLERTKNLLIKLTTMDSEAIDERIEKEKGRPPYRPIKLKENLSWEEVVKISAYKFELPGVSIDVGLKRNYKYRDATAHLIGYLGEISEKEYSGYKKMEPNPYSPGDMIGKSGIEVSLEDRISGVNGGKQVEVDAHGRLVSVVKNIRPYPGNNTRLTIDLPTQLAAWEGLKDKAGAVVAIDPRNGKILAMVSAPSFDPNDLSDGLSRKKWEGIITNPFKVLTNRAIQGQYPPASTFKPITAAAALEEGVIGPETKIYAGPSFWFSGHEYRDWKEEGHGTISVHRAIVESADTFFYQVGLKAGLERLSRYAKEFGLGEKTGVALMNEKEGLVPSSEWKKRIYGVPWYEGETVSLSVGQGLLTTTPLQLLNAYSAIANGGTLYLPKLIESIETPEGDVTEKFAPQEKRRVNISQKTLNIIKDALRGVVAEEGGTGHYILNVGGLEIAGKTGTAQVARLKERTKNIYSIPYQLRDHAWFVGFAPFNDPRIAVCVLVEHGGFGASAAAPVALSVIQTYLEGNPDIMARYGLYGAKGGENATPEGENAGSEKPAGKGAL